VDFCTIPFLLHIRLLGLLLLLCLSLSLIFPLPNCIDGVIGRYQLSELMAGVCIRPLHGMVRLGHGHDEMGDELWKFGSWT
jgi:hypothetical protein